VDIPIDEPHVVGIQKTQLFKNEVIGRLARRKGLTLIKAQRPLDIILNRGLILISTKLNTVFYETEHVSMLIYIFKPDVVETSQTGEIIKVNVMSIKNTYNLKEYHYLQFFVYKLALEKALVGTTMKKYKVVPSIIYWKADSSHQLEAGEYEDIEGFSSMLSSISEHDLFSETDISDEQTFCINSLQRIGTLNPQQDKTKCESCVGKLCCDVFNEIDFIDKHKWFDKFRYDSDNLRNNIKKEMLRHSGSYPTSNVKRGNPTKRIVYGEGFIMKDS
jgi:hypothetical protein